MRACVRSPKTTDNSYTFSRYSFVLDNTADSLTSYQTFQAKERSYFLVLREVVGQNVPLLGVLDALFLLFVLLCVPLCPLGGLDGVLRLLLEALREALLLADLDLLEQL